MNSTTILLRAADLCEKGWTQGRYEQGGCFCVVGAIAKASGSEWTVRSRIEQDLQKFLGVSSLTAWNDTPWRTQAEVVSALRSAAALAEKSS